MEICGTHSGLTIHIAVGKSIACEETDEENGRTSVICRRQYDARKTCDALEETGRLSTVEKTLLGKDWQESWNVKWALSIEIPVEVGERCFDFGYKNIQAFSLWSNGKYNIRINTSSITS